MSIYGDKYITNNAKKTYANMDLVYSDNVYFPESLLNQWLNVSSVMVTCSLVFYHMSRVKSIKMEPYLAKLIATGLIIISTSYTIYALIPYNKRMDFIIKKCSELNECPDDQVEELKFLKKSYMILGLITFMIQCVIVYLVITHI